ncbi:LAQU0S01e01618g1_1 [Lachancea quebecensis]|uniref:2-(3-amino-3-carboxypropyl)histidine synthase subunit 2 n=1 Tax=Lachancea quebecensis TaxID=1654605 RepID=A0A0P1KLM2_9SACH|nr:LAQU0S01e01618g1_1 [Lachancea quebecensis]
MEAETVAAPALSTSQGDEVFSLGRYNDAEKDRSSYLGQNVTDRGELAEMLKKYYMVDEMIKFLNENTHFNKITLQFPDYLVKDSALITQFLQQELVQKSCQPAKEESACRANTGSACCQSNDLAVTERRVWILADTAYSSCCVDEVASEHVNGDLVIHFGDACLNAVQRLPALYCFGRPFIRLDEQVSKFQETYPRKDSKVVLMSNATYAYHLEALYDSLRAIGYENIVYSDVNTKFAGDNAFFLGTQQHDDSEIVYNLDNRILLSKEAKVIQNDEELQNDFDLFHVTQPDDPRLLFLTTKFNSVSIFDPSTSEVSQGPFPSMMKRYKFMHVARTAGTIGLLVNTLSLRNTKETVDKLAKLIRKNGKKHYMFVVGKPNVAKLANFEPIDVWCILGCSQSGIILDQFNEFLKPIVTPYELTMALNPEITWTGQWVLDFKQVLKEIEDEELGDQTTDDEPTLEEESEAPEFDAVRGQYVSSSRPLRNLRHIDISSPVVEPSKSSNQLVERLSGTVAIGNTLSTSATHLQNRQWTGLGSDFTAENYEEDGATVEEGGSGIASQYQFDKHNQA